jgi:flagellar assembly protein FliH
MDSLSVDRRGRFLYLTVLPALAPTRRRAAGAPCLTAMVAIIRSPVMLSGKRRLTSCASPLKAEQSADIADVDKTTTTAAPAPSEDAGAQRTQDLVEQVRRSILTQIKSEAEAARELGRQRGLQEGRAAGREETQQAFAAELARVRSIAGKLSESLASGIGGMEDLAVAIAFEAVCKVLGEAALTQEGVRAQVRQATAHAKNKESLVVRLHPADLSALRAAGALNAILPPGKTVSWVADDSIELGGCVVATDGGALDARLETQLERMRGTLLAARRQAI